MIDQIEKLDPTGKFTVIVERKREVAFRASYAMKWAIGMHNVDAWIDCPTCDLSIGVNGKVRPPNDDEFISIVRASGWTFIPGKKIICSECKVNYDPRKERKE